MEQGRLEYQVFQFAQSLPLTGQTLGLPENTTYFLSKNDRCNRCYVSAWSTAQTGTALATGIGDIIVNLLRKHSLTILL